MFELQDDFGIKENNEWLYPKYVLKKYLIFNDYDFKYVKTINNQKYFKRVTENLAFFYEKKLYKKIIVKKIDDFL